MVPTIVPKQADQDAPTMIVCRIRPGGNRLGLVMQCLLVW